jgi:hypothetical protein
MSVTAVIFEFLHDALFNGVLRTGWNFHSRMVQYGDKVLDHLSGVCAVHIVAYGML